MMQINKEEKRLSFHDKQSRRHRTSIPDCESNLKRASKRKTHEPLKYQKSSEDAEEVHDNGRDSETKRRKSSESGNTSHPLKKREIKVEKSTEFSSSDSEVEPDRNKGAQEKESGEVSQSQESSDDTERISIRQELSDMSFEELEKLKEEIGMKLYKEAVFGEQKRKIKKDFKRANKNRPREVSSKAPVSSFRDVFQVKKKVHKDPRFDDKAGEYSEKKFRHSYSFINDIRKKERETLESLLEEEKDPEEKKKIKSLIQRMKNQEVTEKMKNEEDELDKEYNRYLAEQTKEGKKPHYLTKAEKKKIILAERFKKLKKSGKLEKYLEKRRKKNAFKERKHLPVK